MFMFMQKAQVQTLVLQKIRVLLKTLLEIYSQIS